MLCVGTEAEDVQCGSVLALWGGPPPAEAPSNRGGDRVWSEVL